MITAPYFSNRNRINRRVASSSHVSVPQNLENIDAYLRASLPIIINDSFEFSEVALKRARGDMSWVPSENFSMGLLRDAYQRAEARELREIAFRSDNVRRRVWQQALVAGPLVKGQPNYDYMIAADEKMYVRSASVSIDNSPVSGDPEATIQKARKVRNAYMGVAMPNTADYKAASSAVTMGINARRELITNIPDPISASEVMLVAESEREPKRVELTPSERKAPSPEQSSATSDDAPVNAYQSVATNSRSSTQGQTGLFL